jgi:hypothetical protein
MSCVRVRPSAGVAGRFIVDDGNADDLRGQDRTAAQQDECRGARPDPAATPKSLRDGNGSLSLGTKPLQPTSSRLLDAISCHEPCHARRLSSRSAPSGPPLSRVRDRGFVPSLAGCTSGGTHGLRGGWGTGPPSGNGAPDYQCVASLVAKNRGYSWGISRALRAALLPKPLVESRYDDEVPPRNENVGSRTAWLIGQNHPPLRSACRCATHVRQLMRDQLEAWRPLGRRPTHGAADERASKWQRISPERLSRRAVVVLPNQATVLLDRRRKRVPHVVGVKTDEIPLVTGIGVGCFRQRLWRAQTRPVRADLRRTNRSLVSAGLSRMDLGVARFIEWLPQPRYPERERPDASRGRRLSCPVRRDRVLDPVDVDAAVVELICGAGTRLQRIASHATDAASRLIGRSAYCCRSGRKDIKVGAKILCTSQAVAGEVSSRSRRSAGERSQPYQCAPRATAIGSEARLRQEVARP